LAAARVKWHAGELSAEALKEIEDKAVRDVVALQESVGLKSVTDGEFRRDAWHLDFIYAFDGIEPDDQTHGISMILGEKLATQRVVGRIGKNSGYMRDHFEFLKSATRETAKFCIPAPALVYIRGGRAAIDEDAYPDLDEFWNDLVAAYAAEVKVLADIGCTYLQFDDTSLAFLCDPEYRAKMSARGDQPDKLVERYASATSQAIANRPAGMSVTCHMCRGNYKSTWMTQGGYEPVAEIMFANLDVDGYFMEFDDERSGGFEPLRFVPDDKLVVVGVITSKTPELEPKDAIKRRIDEAVKYVPLERLCLSPQCGFSSTHHGNVLTEDEERRKLAHVVEIAEEIWGSA
jgi:5-methyltetrahydropteroyltriglutamate--homocysteine methyltransferase